MRQKFRTHTLDHTVFERSPVIGANVVHGKEDWPFVLFREVTWRKKDEQSGALRYMKNTA